MPKWNTISISGYHIREAGSTAVQEIAFTIANGIAYVEAAIAAGMDIDAFAPRLSFFWNAHNNFFEEVAKFRAARRIWYRLMDERFAAKKESSKLLRFHAQTGGSTLTAQQPENNVVRVAIQSMAAVMGGTQSLHTNGYDEALSLPSQQSAQVALRTQQIIGYESGIADTPDPLAGSYFVETLTDEIERLAWQYIERIDEMGGAVEGIEAGFQQGEIEQAAYEYAKSIDDDERVIVGLNKFTVPTGGDPDIFPVDPELERGQVVSLGAFKAARDAAAVEARLADLTAAARGTAEPPVPDEGSTARQRHPRRGQRRPARRVRCLSTRHVAGATVPVTSWLTEHADDECCDITTIGRRSGRAHEIEIWFGVIGDTMYLISGNGPTADWYRNALADPQVSVRLAATTTPRSRPPRRRSRRAPEGRRPDGAEVLVGWRLVDRPHPPRLVLRGPGAGDRVVGG